MTLAPAAASDTRRSLEFWLARSPPQLLFRWRASLRLVVLAYHGVSDPETFTQHVRYLARTLRPVSLEDVLDAYAGRTQLPRSAVLVTFDDADRSVCQYAMPILQGHGVPAVAFVVAGLLDSSAAFWWVEVEELVRRRGTAPGLDTSSPAVSVRALKRVSNDVRLRAIEALRRTAPGELETELQLQRSDLAVLEAAGIRVGNHTLTHPCLDRCTDAEVAAEVTQAHEVLTAALGRVPRAFAYPNGNHDPRAARVLEGLGYGAAFLFDHRVGSFPPRDRFRISRVRVNSTTSLDRFRLIISGLHPALHHAVGRT